MFGNRFDSALAMLCFLQAYLKELREEVSMKEKKERERRLNEAAGAAPDSSGANLRPVEVHRRRFWHRRPRAAAAPARPRTHAAQFFENRIA